VHNRGETMAILPRKSRLIRAMGHRPDVIANPTRRRTMSAEPHIPAEPAFSFAFQPIVDTVAREVVAWEALIRGMWDEPAWQVLNQVSPLAFPSFRSNRALCGHRAGRTSRHRPPFAPELFAAESRFVSKVAPHHAGSRP